MDSVYQSLNFVFSLLGFLVIFPALWISRRLLPALLEWARVKPLQGFVASPSGKLILWLALGGFLTFPMMDLISWFTYLIQAIAPNTGQVTTIFGSVSASVYTLVPLIVMLVVYGVVLLASRRLWTAPGRISPIERFFMAAGFASLAYHAVQEQPQRLLFLAVPTPLVQKDLGVSGMLLGWVLGLALLGICLLVLNLTSTHYWSDEEV